MKAILYTIIGFYSFVCVLLYFLQEKLIFIPEQLPMDYQFSFSSDFEEQFFQIDEDTNINALHFFAKASKGVILYFHGNAGSLRGWGDVAEEFVQLGYDVLIPDYRGYGKSKGQISEEGFYRDAEWLYQFLLEKYEEKDIIIYGRSLGTGVATDLASKTHPGKLILETPFSNFVDMAQQRFKIFPVKILLKYQFRNDQKIRKVKSPVYLFHGTNDEVIPYEESLSLVEILDKPTVLTTIQGGNHNNLPDFREYWQKINTILR